MKEINNKINCVICGNEESRKKIKKTVFGKVCLNCKMLMNKKKINSAYKNYYDVNDLRRILLHTDIQNIDNDKYRYFLKGTNGQLFVYNNKIEITRNGFYSFLEHGLKGSKTIPISEIKSIQLKLAGFSIGYIQFGIGGSIEGKAGLNQAVRDENTITFNTLNNLKAEEIKKYLENLILNKNAPQPTIISSSSNADEIKKYKELLDMGAITEEEFDQKKKQLLNI